MDQQTFLQAANEKAAQPFPYLVREVKGDKSLSKDPGFRVMHWHGDIQFLYVAKGTIGVQTLQDTIWLETGEAVFINQNVVHLVIDPDEAHYYSLLFPPALLQFYPGCPANDDISAVIDAEAISLCSLTTGKDWCRPALTLLQDLACFTKKEPAFYAYEVLLCLFRLILLIRQHCTVDSEYTPSIEAERTRRMLQYIAGHYAEDISLDDLAQRACCSKSSCLHAFRRCLQTTPYRYMLDYRLQQAARLLRTTQEPVGSIAIAVGFHQFSLFGKYFKARLGCTPTEYRKRNSGPL